MEYEIIHQDEGPSLVVSSDGRAMPIAVLDLVFELHKQNPRFSQTWMKLAEEYVFLGVDVQEA